MEQEKQRLIEVFRKLSMAYRKFGLSELNAERVQDLLWDLEAEDGFFQSSSDVQSRRLRFMMEIHIGRGEMCYALEKDGGVDPSFWIEFKMVIEEYLEALSGKSYPFPER